MSLLVEILTKQQADLLSDWNRDLVNQTRTNGLSEKEIANQSKMLLEYLRDALQQDGNAMVDAPAMSRVRQFLVDVADARARQGFTPSEIAALTFSLKRPVFLRLEKLANGADQLSAEIWAATELIDGLGLHTLNAFLRSREELIKRQEQDMLELSTPVVQLWKGILALPLIGTLDSARTQVVMETLLQKIVETESRVAIIDITGVPTVDTLVAQHLLKTVTAARLMGADCIISGIRPQIAQTIVHLGIELTDVTTRATLAGAFQLALQRTKLNAAALHEFERAKSGAKEF